MKRLLASLALLFALLLPGTAFAAIAFDNVLITNSSSASYSYTTSGSNRFLALYVLTGASTNCSATYNGVAMTLQQNQQWQAQSNWTQMLSLMAPASGANTLAIGSCTPLVSTAVSYTGVSQSGQPEVSNKTSSTGTGVSNSLTTLTDNNYIIGACGNNGGNPTAYTNWTERGVPPNNGMNVADTNAAQTIGAHTQGCSNVGAGGGNIWSMVQMAIAPSAAVAATNPIARLVRAFFDF